jgi:D-arginine dehydrogenase
VKRYDVLVIGGGIAGVSIGYELAADRTVALLEMENTLAFHTTGRSAATFLESYGGRVIRLLTTASRAFMESPPAEFNRPLLSPMPLLWIGPHGTADDVRALYDEVIEFVPDCALLSASQAAAQSPAIREDWLELAMTEPGASEIDVAAVHQGFTTGLRNRHGEIYPSAGVVGLHYADGIWRATDRSGEVHEAPIVVNAAGAWCDEVAVIAGVQPVGIHPLRRTVFMVSAPGGADTRGLPLVADVRGTFYIKPEGEQYLCSPADETPSAPCDARPEEIDIAKAIEHINEATTLDIRHVRRSWAGLRNFVADRSPVVGFDDAAPGFFWFVGQGGYGIQISPALARVGAALVRDGDVPADLRARGLAAEHLSRQRLAGLTGLHGH